MLATAPTEHSGVPPPLGATEHSEVPPPLVAPTPPPAAPAKPPPAATSLDESRQLRTPTSLQWSYNDGPPSVHKKDLAWLIDNRVVKALVGLTHALYKSEVFDEQQQEVEKLF